MPWQQFSETWPSLHVCLRSLSELDSTEAGDSWMGRPSSSGSMAVQGSHLGRYDVNYVELRDDIVWVSADRKCYSAG